MEKGWVQLFHTNCKILVGRLLKGVYVYIIFCVVRVELYFSKQNTMSIEVTELSNGNFRVTYSDKHVGKVNWQVSPKKRASLSAWDIETKDVPSFAHFVCKKSSQFVRDKALFVSRNHTRSGVLMGAQRLLKGVEHNLPEHGITAVVKLDGTVHDAVTGKPVVL